MRSRMASPWMIRRPFLMVGGLPGPLAGAVLGRISATSNSVGGGGKILSMSGGLGVGLLAPSTWMTGMGTVAVSNFNPNCCSSASVMAVLSLLTAMPLGTEGVYLTVKL